MGERVPVEVGQVRRRPGGQTVRVIEPNTYLDAFPGVFCVVRNTETNRLSYPMRSTVERWEVVHDPR